MNLNITSNSPAETEKIAEGIGRQAKGGEVVELVSDLGGGKTTFVRGLARGMGITDHVNSPTFTINNLYNGDKLELCHFDLYRLSDAGLAGHELQEAIDSIDSLVVVEWANVANKVLPRDRLTVALEVTDELTRELTFYYPDQLKYLIKDL